MKRTDGRRSLALVAAVLGFGLPDAFAEPVPQRIEAGRTLPTRFGLVRGAAGTCTSFSELRIHALDWLPSSAGEPARLAVSAVFGKPRERCTALPAPGPWFRVIDEAGLIHVLDSNDAWAGQRPPEGGDLHPVVVFGRIPASARRIRLLVGQPAAPDGELSVNLETGQVSRSTPSKQPPEQRLALLAAHVAGPLSAEATTRTRRIRSQLRVDLSDLVDQPGRECLRDVVYLIPEMRLEGQVAGTDGRVVDELRIARAFTNRGRSVSCELPGAVWFSDDRGEVAWPERSILAMAPAFSSFVDLSTFKLVAGARRGRLYVSESPSTEPFASFLVDFEKRSVESTHEVVGRFLVQRVGEPVSDAAVELRGETKWRPDRTVVLSQTTDSEGRFRFRHVEPGRYVMTVFWADSIQYRRPLVLREVGNGRLGPVYMDVPRPNPGFIGVTIDRHAQGVVVRSVMRLSPAARAGLRAGDVIESVDGSPIRDLKDSNRIRGAPGSRVELTLLRGGQVVTVTATRAK